MSILCVNGEQAMVLEEGREEIIEHCHDSDCAVMYIRSRDNDLSIALQQLRAEAKKTIYSPRMNRKNENGADSCVLTCLRGKVAWEIRVVAFWGYIPTFKRCRFYWTREAP